MIYICVGGEGRAEYLISVICKLWLSYTSHIFTHSHTLSNFISDSFKVCIFIFFFQLISALSLSISFFLCYLFLILQLKNVNLIFSFLNSSQEKPRPFMLHNPSSSLLLLLSFFFQPSNWFDVLLTLIFLWFLLYLCSLFNK